MPITEKDYEAFCLMLDDLYEEYTDEYLENFGVTRKSLGSIVDRLNALDHAVLNIETECDDTPYFEVGTLPTFREHPSSFRSQALKVVEEAAELFSAAEAVDKGRCWESRYDRLLEEASDVIQSVVNLFDMAPHWRAKNALRQMIVKNARRGRY